MQKNSEKFGISDKRGRVQTSSDPFHPEKGMKEPAICSGCGAVYIHKRWTLDPDQVAAVKKNPEAHKVECPACQKIAQNYAEGHMILKGDYLWAHEEEICALLKTQERKAMNKNPLERIIRIERGPDSLLVETTEKKLAEHLGRALHNAHQGELDVSWDNDHTLCRVSWKR
ncbi:MAG: hypothetical protein J7K75_10825 [Desulfuromonas sp.]|nr:hypothetical protein [Desulfuromonas sp.]